MKEIREKIQKHCLERENAFCSSACPFDFDVREFILRMQRGGFNSAYRTYSNSVGFPAIVSELCGEPCRLVCPREKTDRAISLRMLEQSSMRYAVNTKPNSYNMPAKGRSIAIVGSGASGLACALRLTNKKYSVTVFEQSDRIGGHLWNILDPDVFLKDIEKQFMYEKHELCLNTKIQDINKLANGFDAVYIATGRDGDDFGLLRGIEDIEGVPSATGIKGVFLGGSLVGANSVEAIAQGLRASQIIEAFLKTGNMKSAPAVQPTKIKLDPEAIIYSEPILPSNGDYFTKEEAAAEANRCIRCRCDSCNRHCALMNYFDKFPMKIDDEVEATINPGTLDGNGTIATRFISTCNQCGLCGEVCPEDIDMGDFLRKSHHAMRAKDAMPWVFHEFWLRDMEFSNSERAAFTAAPPGCGRSEYVFFPGCQLGASNPDYVTETYRFIRSVKSDAAISLGCCGAPAVWSGDRGLYSAVHEKIKSEWKQMGEPVAILACPSCMQFFAEYLPEIKTRFLYDILCEWGARAALSGEGEKVSVFDPCSSRHMTESQENIRHILSTSGYSLEALPYEKKRAQCCSWGGQISIANPTYRDWLVRLRASEGSAPYVVYCSNCRDAFADAGKPVKHILDILWGLSERERPTPTISERRDNREFAKRSVISEFWPELSNEVSCMDKSRLTMSDEIREKLNRSKFLEEDVLNVIESCEKSGRIIKKSPCGHFLGYREIGHMTYWVEYLPKGDGYEVINAYSHRMKIELEDVWNGRKRID